MTENNPATRLHKVLTRAAACDANKPVVATWLNVFGIHKSDLGLLLRSLADLDDLAKDAADAIRLDQSADIDLYLTWVGPVNKAINPRNLSARWQEHKQCLSDTVLIPLAFCGDYLSRSAPEPTIQDDRVEDLIQQSTDLIGEVAKSHLDAAEKNRLLSLLHEFQFALRNLQITGIHGLEASVHRTIGSIVFQYNATSPPPKSGIGGKVMTFFATVACILSTINGAFELTDNALPHIRDFLGAPSTIVEVIKPGDKVVDVPADSSNLLSTDQNETGL